MAIHTLFPAFVRIEYESDRGQHSMTRPTRAWSGIPWAGPGTYEAWDESTIAADVMIEGLITLMLPLFTEQVTFTSYLIYTLPETGALPVPVFAKNLTGQTGENLSTSQYLTFQKIYTYLTADNNPAKLVLMDVPTGGVVSRVSTLPPGGELDLVNELMDVTKAWAGRDDSRIIAWRSLSNGVNDKLKRLYRM